MDQIMTSIPKNPIHSVGQGSLTHSSLCTDLHPTYNFFLYRVKKYHYNCKVELIDLQYSKDLEFKFLAYYILNFYKNHLDNSPTLSPTSSKLLTKCISQTSGDFKL